MRLIFKAEQVGLTDAFQPREALIKFTAITAAPLYCMITYEYQIKFLLTYVSNYLHIYLLTVIFKSVALTSFLNLYDAPP